MSYRVALVSSLALSLVACTERGEDASPPIPEGSDGGAPPAMVDAGHDSGPRPDSGPNLDDVLIYAHSADTLFGFSPRTNTVTEVGRFRLPNGRNAPDMLDLAVNAEGDVFTSSRDTLFRVDPETALATAVGDFDLDREQLFALTFLAPGALGAGSPETLVGATNEGFYYAVDVRDASTEELGEYPDGWLSSGDLVSVEGLGTYATLKRAEFATDVLARIDFRADGSSRVTVLGPIGYRQLFGLGFWGRSLYGFSNDGELIEINPTSGVGRVATPDTGTDQFWGAGVTTRAPILL